jgi:hypothetical protein
MAARELEALFLGGVSGVSSWAGTFLATCTSGSGLHLKRGHPRAGEAADSSFWDSKVGFIMTGGLLVQLSNLNAATQGPAKLKDRMSRVSSRE